MNANIIDTSTKIHQETQKGNFKSVSVCILNGVDVNSADLDNNTPLHISVANNHLDITNFLIENGANIEASNCLGWSPIMQAARHGHHKIVCLLISKGADVEKVNRFGMTSLMLAAVNGHLETVRHLIDNGAKYIESINSRQVSALSLAALYGNDAVVRLFLDKGVSANSSAPDTGITPLMFAACGGELSTVKILLERGAKPETVNVGEFSAFDVAKICSRNEIANLFKGHSMKSKRKIKSEEGTYDIMDAAYQGNMQALQEILCDDPSKAKMITGEGATPLMMASMMNHVTAAQLLLQYDADIDAQDYINGWTPIMQAIYHRHTNMVKHLFEYGADINIVTPGGYTAFDLANEILEPEILKLFSKLQIDSMLLVPDSSALSSGSSSFSSKRDVSSPTLQSIKQWWNKVSHKTTPTRPTSEYGTKKNTQESQGSFSLYPSVPSIKYEPIVRELDYVEHEEFSTNIFNNFTKLQMDARNRMIPPSWEPSAAISVKPMPAGRRTAKGNLTFSNQCYANLIEKIRNVPITCDNLGLDVQEPTSTLRSKVKLPNIKISNAQPTENESCDSLNSSLTFELSQSLGPDLLAELMQNLSMKSKVGVLEEQEIDIETFFMLTPTDFKELGFSPQKIQKIMKAISSVKSKI